MKRIYILIFAIIYLQSFSQKDNSRYYNAWRLGLNLGGAWQTADYRSCWGMAGGFTLEKGLRENNTNFFSFAIRGRYLGANTYGMDYNRNYRVKSNDAYNGKYDPIVNFADSLPANRQYVFDNYKMTLGEGSLELQLSFNRLRERTHVILNLWGGVGVTSYRTKSDLLDGDKKMYNFSLVDSSGNQTKVLNSYNGIIDKNYESYAYGSRNGDLVTFSPSAGIGLGYQFSPGFSILWEYKITLPQGTNADLLDGKLSLNNDRIGGSNDYYHYTGLNFLFTLRGKKKTKSNGQQTANVNVPVSSPTPSVTPSTSVAPTPSVTPIQSPGTNTQLQPKVSKPIVSFITPSSAGIVVNNQQYKISAKILNVSTLNAIQFKFNGIIHSDFVFDAQTHQLEYKATLLNGNNSVQIVASNSAGSDTKVTSIILENVKPAGNPPVISFINPGQSGTVVSAQKYTITAQVLNVSEQKNISLYYNGLSTPFSFNAVNKQISLNVDLNSGSNSISITATNNHGEDTKASTIIYKNEPKLPPVVSLKNPSVAESTTENSSYNFKLDVLNVISKSDIQVSFNGISQGNFTYDAQTKELNLQSNLAIGENSLLVKGSNQFGFDTKQIKVVYTPRKVIKHQSLPIETEMLPVVTILKPVNQPVVMAPLYEFQFKVLNATKQQIEVKLNGTPVTSFNFSSAIGSFTSNLVPGNTILKVKAINAFGSDVKTENVLFRFGKDTVSVPTSTSGTTDEKKITICHLPPGNKENPQTISIPASALSAHLSHGDTQGSCPSKKDTIRVIKPNVKPLNNNLERGNGTPSVEPNNLQHNPR